MPVFCTSSDIKKKPLLLFSCFYIMKGPNPNKIIRRWCAWSILRGCPLATAPNVAHRFLSGGWTGFYKAFTQTEHVSRVFWFLRYGQWTSVERWERQSERRRDMTLCRQHYINEIGNHSLRFTRSYIDMKVSGSSFTECITTTSEKKDEYHYASTRGNKK